MADDVYRPPDADLATNDGPDPRRDLLPRWIRVFSWGFLVIGPLGIVVSSVMAIVYPEPMMFEFLGIRHFGRPTDPESIVVLALFVAFSVAAYGLLWYRSWGLWAGLACGFGGLAVVLVSMAVDFGAGGRTIRIEPVAQIPFIIALLNRRERWREITG